MRSLIETLMVTALAGLLCACSKQKTVCDSYHSTPVEGWEQHNVLTYTIDTLKQDGTYHLNIGVRSTNAYPFQSLWLLVREKFQSPDYEDIDTLVCYLTDRQGNTLGQGVSIFQYDCPLKDMELHKGQYGTITVNHIMRRTILPGISDIGVILKKK